MYDLLNRNVFFFHVCALHLFQTFLIDNILYHLKKMIQNDTKNKAHKNSYGQPPLIQGRILQKLKICRKNRKHVNTFDENFLKYCGLSGAKACKSCRSRQELSNEYFLAKFGVDTEENEPYKVCSFG